MNNHFSPKAPKPLLWPQTPLGVSPPLLRLPRRSFGCPAAPSVATPLLRLPRLSLGCPAAPSVGEPIFLHSHSSLATPLVAYSGARSARKASSRAPNRLICSRGSPPRRSRAPNRQICSRDPHPTSSRAPNRLVCSRGPPPRRSRAPNRQICSRGPPPRRSRAPNRLVCSRGSPPRPSRAPNCQICSRDPHPASIPCAKPPYLLTTNEYNAGWPHFLHSFKSCRKSSSQEYATGGSMVFFGTGRSIDPSPPAILAIFSIRSAGSSGLKKATLPHPADVS